MDLGLRCQIVVVSAGISDEAEACKTAFEDEGATVLLGSPGADLLEIALSRHGQVDVVVSVLPQLGSFSLTAEPEVLLDACEPLLDTIALYQAALPAMRRARHGRLIGVTSTGVKAIVDDREELDAVCGLALLGLHKTIATEEGRHAITANVVLRNDVTKPSDLAAAVTFLASGRAGYLSGITLAVDGGQTPAVF